jgi:hypothetical protein
MQSWAPGSLANESSAGKACRQHRACLSTSWSDALRFRERLSGFRKQGKQQKTDTRLNPEMAVFLRIIQIKVFFKVLEHGQKIPVIVIGVGKAPEITCHGIPISELLEIPFDQIREIDRAKAFLLEKRESADQHADECVE